MSDGYEVSHLCVGMSHKILVDKFQQKISTLKYFVTYQIKRLSRNVNIPKSRLSAWLNPLLTSAAQINFS